MCDTGCSLGIGVTAGVVGVMMTIICCKTLCEFLLELSQPVATQTPPLRDPRVVAPTVLEMPIVIRIYMPQPGAVQQSQQGVAQISLLGPQGEQGQQSVVSTQYKKMFEPLPV